MQVTLFAAVSADGFIADKNGDGNFSTPEDKKLLRSFLNGKACDCFVCGRKTAEEFQDRLTAKPLFVLTRQKRENAGNRLYFSTPAELDALTKRLGLRAPTLLGGAETYDFFLKNGLVDRVVLTTESVRFETGTAFDFPKYAGGFDLIHVSRLSGKTKVSFFERKK